MFSYRVLNYTKTKKKQQPPSNEIWYWAPEKIDSSFEERWVYPGQSGLGEVNVVSHTFEKGKGVITCDGDITVIQNGAFSGCTTITKVHLPEGLLNIHAAFGGCTGLEYVIFPKSIETIDDSSSFGGCTNLREIDLSDCVNLTVISGSFGSCGTNHGLKCFDLTNCINLTTFYSSINNNVKINRLSFLNCKSLTSINEQFNGTIIDLVNFKGCSALSSISGSFGNMNGGLKNLNLSECPNLKTISGSFSGSGTSKRIIKTLVLGNYNDISISGSFANLLITKLNITPKIGIYSLSNSFNYCLDLKTLIFDCPLLNSMSGCFMYGDIKFLTIKNVVISNSSILGGNFKSNKTEELTLDSFGSNASYYLNSHISSFSPNIKRLNIKNMKFYAGSYLNNYDSLRSVLFENVRFDLTSNGFSFCKNLLSITFKNSYSESNYVGNFQGCESLREIDFSESETIKYINNYSFRNCTSLKSVKFNDNLYNIYSNAFENCTSLKNVKFGKYLGYVYDLAFKNCTSLKSVKFESNLYQIYGYCFDGCVSLKEIDFSKCTNLSRINYGAFRNCKLLKKLNFDNCLNVLFDLSNLLDGSGIEYFSAKNNKGSLSINYSSNGMFYNTPKLKSIDLEGSNVSNLSYVCQKNNGYTDSAFSHDEFKSINLKNCKNLSSIYNSFYDCPKLNNINLEGCDGLTRIEGSFGMCPKIKNFNNLTGTSNNNLEIKNSFQSNINSDILDLSNVKWTTIKLNKILEDSSKTNILIDGNSNITIFTGTYDTYYYDSNPGNIVKIEIKNCSNLTEIRQFNLINSLEELIIENCPNLTTMTGTFNSCSKLKKITIKNCPNLIVNNSFINNPELTVLEFNEIKQITGGSFGQCIKLLNPQINNIESITNSFNYSGNVENLFIPDSLSELSNSFVGLSIDNIILGQNNLTFKLLNNSLIEIESNKIVLAGNNATIPSEGDVIIGIGAFAGKNITNIVIPANVVQILDGAFNNISNILSITVDENNQYYDSRNDCNAIIETETNTLIKGCANTVIPDTVTTIYSESFYGCDDLTSITIGENVESVELDAFVNCNNLTSVIINSQTFIGSSSFTINRTCANRFGNLVTNYIFGSNVTSIRGYALFEAANVESITLLGDITSLDRSCFEACVVGHNRTININISNLNAWLTRTNSNLGSGPFGNNCFYDLYLNGIKVTEVTVPSDMTTIKERTFSNCSSITSVIIPNGATNISNYAFQRCSSLTSVTIPDSIETIGNYAFDGCSSLTNVTIPDSVTSIGNNIFAGCSSLTSVIIGSGITNITNYMFSKCSSLTSITIPDNIESINDYAFYDCDGLSNIIIGSGVTSISNYAFSSSSSNITNNIESIIVDENNTVYDSRNNCNAIINSSTNALIKGCKNTTIPLDIVEISANSFNKCESLTSIVIPEGVTTIGDRAFENCSNLTDITIPSSVTSIGNYAFWSILRLTINSDSIVSKNYTSSNNLFNVFNKLKLLEIVIGDGITSIGTSIFDESYYGNSTNITSIVIPDSVTTINTYAFRNCGQLTTLYLGSNVTNIYDLAFSNNKISNLYYNGDLESWLQINNDRGLELNDCNVYFNNEKVTEITIPDNITSIRKYALLGFNSLTNVIIPNTVTSIGDYAFSRCSSSELKVVIPSSVSSYGKYLFLISSGITSVGISGSNSSVELPNNISKIYDSMFNNCDNLTTVNIPYGVTSIESSAFNYCKSLENVVIPSSVTSIGYHAFYNCYKLKSLIIYTSSNISIDGGMLCYTSDLTEKQALDLFKDLKIYVHPSKIDYYKSQLPLFKTRIYPIS